MPPRRPRPSPTAARDAWRDVRDVSAGVVPFGLFLGVTLTAYGEHPLAVLTGAAAVYGGSAQLATSTVLHAGAGRARRRAGRCGRQRPDAAVRRGACRPLRATSRAGSVGSGPPTLLDQTYLSALNRPDYRAAEFRRYWGWLSLDLLVVWLARRRRRRRRWTAAARPSAPGARRRGDVPGHAGATARRPAVRDRRPGRGLRLRCRAFVLPGVAVLAGTVAGCRRGRCRATRARHDRPRSPRCCSPRRAGCSASCWSRCCPLTGSRPRCRTRCSTSLPPSWPHSSPSSWWAPSATPTLLPSLLMVVGMALGGAARTPDRQPRPHCRCRRHGRPHRRPPAARAVKSMRSPLARGGSSARSGPPRAAGRGQPISSTSRLLRTRRADRESFHGGPRAPAHGRDAPRRTLVKIAHRQIECVPQAEDRRTWVSGGVAGALLLANTSSLDTHRCHAAPVIRPGRLRYVCEPKLVDSARFTPAVGAASSRRVGRSI